MSSYFFDFYLKDGVLCTRDKDSDLNLEFLRMNSKQCTRQKNKARGKKNNVVLKLN